MTIRHNYPSADSKATLKLLLDKREVHKDNAEDIVAPIITRVKSEGDKALREYTAEFDQYTLWDGLRITTEKINEYASQCEAKVVTALKHAAERIKDFHKRSIPHDIGYDDEYGNYLGGQWSAIDRAGLYVPGGKAAYPSSVLMNAIPALVAGVREIAMVVPTPKGEICPAVFAAAQILGIDEIYPIGGAQAVAALAYGTETIKAVDTIVGPGNAYVAAAKRYVFGHVGIDSIAGPTEVIVVADHSADPKHVALDLLSQAEHDSDAQAILIAANENIANLVSRWILNYSMHIKRSKIASKSWNNNGAIFIVEDLVRDGAEIINRIAPEHLELMVEDPQPLLDKIRHAGAIFIGHNTPEAIGDYIAGPNHVLPTERSARFSSGLSVANFMKRTSIIKMTEAGLNALGPDAAILADSEGLTGHAQSITARLEKLGI